MKKTIRNFSIVIIIVVALFIFSPLLLKLDFINESTSWFLTQLKNIEYKSSYYASLGALVGTLFAVAGAFLTQKYFDSLVEKKEVKEIATIIYHDFNFAIREIIFNELSYFETERRKKEKILNDEYEYYVELKKRYNIYINKDWTQNVAKLSDVLSNEEIETIYDIYGDLSSISISLSSSLSDYDIHLAFMAFTDKHVDSGKIPKNEIKYAIDCLNDKEKKAMLELMKLGEIKRK